MSTIQQIPGNEVSVPIFQSLRSRRFLLFLLVKRQALVAASLCIMLVPESLY